MADAVSLLEPIGLESLMEQAALQTRVDRKYLVPAEVIAKVIGELDGSLNALEINGKRLFGYQSVYFDTEDYQCFNNHLQGRRRRFKVRTRSYVDSGDCMLEVKLKGGRSETMKSRLPYDSEDAFRLTAEGREFITDLIGDEETGNRLRPVLLSAYSRATLIDLNDLSRVTCDVELEWLSANHHSGEPVGDVLIETKTAGPLSGTDRLLRTYGHRPISISKYCLGVALLNPEMNANPWHRTMRRHFGWTPADGLPSAVEHAS
ncbi:MAG: polyphosphate polymerase domain-containing protein [Aeromicrobium sp.]